MRVYCKNGFGRVMLVKNVWQICVSVACLRRIENFTRCAMQSCLDARLILKCESVATTKGCLLDDVMLRNCVFIGKTCICMCDCPTFKEIV